MKNIILKGSLLVLLSPLVLSAYGSVEANAKDSSSQNIEQKNVSNYSKVNPDIKELDQYGVTVEEIAELKKLEDSGIVLTNGIAVDKDGNVLTIDSMQRGKLSWAVKALRAVWNKIPANIKAAMGGLAGFETILNVVDNFTGAVEDAVYAGCKKVGMSDSVAWWVTKGLMLFL